MARTNGKSEVAPPELDADRELSEGTGDDADDGARPPNAPAGTEVAPSAESSTRDAELQKLKAERDALLDRLARLQAEFENARKRAVREQQEFREFALADALKTLLPILDSFERALQSAPPGKSEFRSGIEHIHRQLQDALQKLGLRPIPAKGEPFDPHLHEAVEMVDTSDARDHEVLEELQSGYKLKDRLLRPAMVKVARNSKH
jgi:molecular chaperone GrpE